MKYGLFKLEIRDTGMRNRWVKVSERVYSSYEIAAFVFMDRIVESKGNLFIRRCV